MQKGKQSHTFRRFSLAHSRQARTLALQAHVLKEKSFAKENADTKGRTASFAFAKVLPLHPTSF